MKQTDVLIIGSGVAGLGAGIAAAENGASAMVLEKRKILGGISVTGMGIFAVESKWQREKNVQFTRDDAFKLFMQKSQWRPNARLVRAYIDKTADTAEWLEAMGVEFILNDQLTFPECVNQTGLYVNSPKRGVGPAATAHLVDCMRQEAEKQGVEIWKEAKVTSLERAGGGYEVKIDHAGAEEVVAAKTVVMASGGYSDNEKILSQNGYTLGQDMWVGHSIPLTGEGIEMAWKLGAVPDGMCPQMTALMAGGSNKGVPDRLGSLISWGLPYLWVNQDGERFIDEGDGNPAYVCNAVARQTGRVWYSIFDGDTLRHLMENGVDVSGYLGDTGNIGELIQQAQELAGQRVMMADSLEELAQKMNVPQERFLNTVEEYNKFCDNGLDETFAKNRRFLRPVRKAKFYAFQRLLGAYGTIGGIKIDEFARATDKDNKPIPGFFAAGDCANGTHTHNYSLVYILWGSTLSFAVNTGRIAGENAAKYVNGK